VVANPKARSRVGTNPSARLRMLRRIVWSRRHPSSETKPSKISSTYRKWLQQVHSPPFSRRGGCAINKKAPFLSGADGVVSNFKQNKERYASIIRRLRDLLLTTPPSASNGLMPRAPLLENGGEWGRNHT
jgi:hypothetical protein